jgi:hypothetical protein
VLGKVADEATPDQGTRTVQIVVLAVLQLALVAELILLVLNQHWVHVFLVTAILATTLSPLVLKPRLLAPIPPEVQIVAILFVFATLFLGEVRDYYERLWWWDLALHTTAGLLLGLLGFMIVYILNEDRLVDLRMRPSFLALFAFSFSQAIGALWEIFEFFMDQTFALSMQKPTPGDLSGLKDTMWDLIVNAVGAIIVSFAGWRSLVRARTSYVNGWAKRFIERNPRLFGN